MNIRVESYLDFLRKDPRAPLLITVVLALLLILNLGHMVSAFTTDTADTPSLLNSHTAHLPPSIASTHLFGQYSETADNLPPTQLQLTLQGIELAVTPGDTYALINTPGQSTQLYKVGDTVPGGATVHGIFRDRVVLTHNEHLEALYLPIPKTNKMVTSATQ